MPDRANPYTLITGGSQGIGRALAMECAKRGRNILIVALETPELVGTAQDIRDEFRVHADTFAIDLTEEDAPRRVYEWTKTKGYEVDMLINNAGFGRGNYFEKLSLETYRSMMRLNNQAMVEMTHHFLPDLKALEQSYLLNMGSLESLLPSPFKGIYTASKHFVKGFTFAVREEAAEDNVHVSLLCPGPVVTNEDGLKRIEANGWKAKLLVMMPEDVAPIAIRGLLRNKRMIIPGTMNNFIAGMNRVLPTSLKMRLMRRVGRTFITSEE